MKIFALFFCSIFGFSLGLYPKVHDGSSVDGDNYGDPLFLTKFITSGKIKEGQSAASVQPLKGNIKSFSGYFTVNEKYKSNMFFWFFPAEVPDGEKAPVVVWLQGGPGASSLFGLFEEIGPFYVGLHRGLKRRNHYWSQRFNMIFIDNPVGTGFSFTDNGYATSQDDVGRDLYNALSQFFLLFPQYQPNELYIAGESYAGKYVPTLAYTIHNENPKAANKMNLKGISIGNGLCDPVNMMKYGDYLYQLGLIDKIARSTFQRREQKIVQLINNKSYTEAFAEFDALLNGDLTPYKSLFYNVTGFTNYFNYLYSGEYGNMGDMNDYLKKDLVRRSIHVGNLTFHDGKEVEKHLMNDVMQSVTQQLAVILNNDYKVLIYNGQLDIIVAYPLTVNFLQSLKWKGSNKYKMADRHQWFVNGTQLAGYGKSVLGLTEILVRDAGHMVPKDQPLFALDMITRFITGKPFWTN